ncbi:MAG: RlmE family RNA methyltransferase, partial [Gammaproteobacteria bacterium]|nr:RlmE family RNA methyltransferase [Gammaproteobacteria bacterium]
MGTNKSKRSKSSDRWLKRQRRDVFTRQAAELGRLSRAHYKLQQLDERFNLLKPRMKVLELGAAPGGWTNYLEQRVTDGLLIVCDPRPGAAAEQTVVIEGEYGEAETEQEISGLLEGRTLDLVL